MEAAPPDRGALLVYHELARTASATRALPAESQAESQLSVADEDPSAPTCDAAACPGALLLLSLSRLGLAAPPQARRRASHPRPSSL